MDDRSYKIVNGITVALILFLAFIMSSIKCIYCDITFTFDGLLTILLLISNPIINLVRNKQKEIRSYVYYIIYDIVLIVISIIYLKGLSFVIGEFPHMFSEGLNKMSFYLSNHDLYMLIALVAVNIFSLFFKKNLNIRKKNYEVLYYIIIFIFGIEYLIYLSISCLSIKAAMSVGVGVFFLVMIFLKNEIHISSELQFFYVVMFIISLYCWNIVGAYFIIALFVNLDKYGLHI